VLDEIDAATASQRQSGAAAASQRQSDAAAASHRQSGEAAGSNRQSEDNKKTKPKVIGVVVIVVVLRKPSMRFTGLLHGFEIAKADSNNV